VAILTAPVKQGETDGSWEFDLASCLDRGTLTRTPSVCNSRPVPDEASPDVSREVALDPDDRLIVPGEPTRTKTLFRAGVDVLRRAA
jgi:hypothetical protein